MSRPLLILGSKNYSSWSLRPWILLRHLGVDFEEVVLQLDTEQFHQEIGKYSPTRRVPVLIDGDVRVWDSLAICEYAGERAADWSGDLAGHHLRVWPADAAARAHARSLCAEMHAGFQALRNSCPMNVRALNVKVRMTPELADDVARIDRIWSGCRQRFDGTGPWLFGEYCAADAMFAPVALRFRSYGAQLSARSREYLETVLADPFLGEWIAAAEVEDHFMARNELRPRRKARGKSARRSPTRTRPAGARSRTRRRAARKR
jgi:glutathione S-transferase